MANEDPKTFGVDHVEGEAAAEDGAEAGETKKVDTKANETGSKTEDVSGSSGTPGKNAGTKETKDGAAKEETEDEDLSKLLEDAKLVAVYGQRAGRIRDTSLFEAIRAYQRA